jgi:DNA adenine methylase
MQDCDVSFELICDDVILPMAPSTVQAPMDAEANHRLGPERPLPLPHLEPFIKWAGGKRHLVDKLTTLLPSTFGKYYEPFLGSAALFFAVRPQAAILADSNDQLIQCYQQVRDNVDKVIAELRALPNTKEDYYRIRSNVPSEPVLQAARLIYLVQLSFNGIYRVNSKTGLFNVPYGQHVERTVLNERRLRLASQALRRATILAGDFMATTESAMEGDIVYMDPPYTVAHNSNGFVRYNQRLFSWHDQERLADWAHELVDRGCSVVVSNAYHRSIRELYPNFTRRRVRRASRMAADKTYRRAVHEYVLIGRARDA